MSLTELLEQERSFILCVDDRPNSVGTLTELIDAYRGDPLPNPKYDMANGRVVDALTYPVVLWDKPYIPADALCFLHKTWWKEQGRWRKGKPQTDVSMWYKKPIPVRIVKDYKASVGDKLLHTFKDDTGEIWYVLETTVATRPKYWLIYG